MFVPSLLFMPIGIWFTFTTPLALLPNIILNVDIFKCLFNVNSACMPKTQSHYFGLSIGKPLEYFHKVFDFWALYSYPPNSSRLNCITTIPNFFPYVLPRKSIRFLCPYLMWSTLEILAEPPPPWRNIYWNTFMHHWSYYLL